MKNKQNQLIKNVSPPLLFILATVIFILAFSFIYIASYNKNKTTSDHRCSTKKSQRKLMPESKKAKGTFPFEIIRAKSRLRKRFVDLNIIPKTLKRIPKAFFQNWLEYIPVIGIEQKFTFQPASHAEFYFYDFAETDDLFLFSIIIRNFDSAQNKLIHFTCDKLNGRINHAELVAATGGEGGYSNHSKMEYSANRLTLIVTAEVSQPIARHWETYRYVTQYTFEPERTTVKELK